MKRQATQALPGDVQISRRGFIHTAAAVTAAVAAAPSAACGTETPGQTLIDTNVSLGSWPFRHTEPSDTPGLVAQLRKQGVTQAWASHLDALLHKDIARVNNRLAEECMQHGAGLLIPMGIIHLKLPDWEEDLRRCHEVHRMPGIRLHPHYHGYTLSDPAFKRLLHLATERDMLVQVSVIMEDERTIHPLANVPPVDTTSLPATLEAFPAARLQLLNAFRTLKNADVDSLATHGVSFEIAMLEGLAGVEKLIQRIPLSSLCFGSYFPVFYFESALLKLQESELAGVQRKAISAENAVGLLKKVW
jgi:predicted TIM-barrel fold metal-dependent hydrolase